MNDAARTVLPPIGISGSQLAVLVFAACFLAVPVASLLAKARGVNHSDVDYLSQLVTFTIVGTALLAIAPFRRRAAALLAKPLQRARYAEIAGVIVIFALGQFALFGSYAVNAWLSGGDAAVMRLRPGFANASEAAMSAATVRHLVIGCALAPLLEELAFRGFLFEAWATTRGLTRAMIFSSAVFALVHPVWTVTFFAGLMLCGVYVRAGSLRASILVHACANALNSQALLGQFLFPRDNQGIGSWWFQIACLIIIPCVVLAYAWMATRSPSRSETAVSTVGMGP